MPRRSGPRRVTTSANLHPSEKTDHAVETADLVRRASAGDAAALERLLVQAQDVAWRFSMTVCGHAEDAEDAMQEALTKTYRHLPTIRDPEAFRPWLYRTIRNVCLMARRRRVDQPTSVLSIGDMLPTPGTSTPIDAPSPLPSPEDAVSTARLRRQLAGAMQTLPPAFRAVVFLRDMEGLSTRETAVTLGLSEDNVKARLHRARLVLRQHLAAWDRTGAARASTRRGHPRATGGRS